MGKLRQVLINSSLVLFLLSLKLSNGAVIVNTGIVKLNLNAGRAAETWFVTGTNGTNEEGQAVTITVPAEVPGGIYSDLEANDTLGGQIYHDYNDMETKWVGQTNWTFSREFSASEELLSKSKVVLVCEGLDTIADVFINDVLVGMSRNMFVRYVFDVKSALQPGTNTIKVAFSSPVEYALKEYERHEAMYGYAVLPPSLVPEFRGENKAQMLRKIQSSFSWDWGPSYASSGIWRNIYIEGLDSAVIRDVLIFQSTNQSMPDETDNTSWNLTAQVYFDVASDTESGTLTFSSVNSTQLIQVNVTLSANATKEGQNVTLVVPGSTAKLWWPNGHGDQNLYTYDITYASATADETTTSTLRVGFRTVELYDELVNATNPDWGREFYFIVNGIPMFSKGSNSIPLHVLPEKITEEMTREVLESARDVHTNMIRIWGGGMYETDIFYDIADELGIFVWEDYMFACAMYPATDEFLMNVVDEVETQVKRLQYHPSLAMWAANNENEGALRDNWYGTESNFSTYREDYIKLYVNTIIANSTYWDPSRKCIPSSPTNGIKSEEEGWISEWPGNPNYGDIHHYDYASDSWDWSIFTRRPRYASEYGYQSFPYIETLAGIASNFDEWTWESVEMEHRQHHQNGQEEMRKLIQSHLPYPIDFNTNETLPAMLYMAQIMQAMGQKTQTEFYRRLVDKLDMTDGSGHTMGALYWQLNDIWQGCSWASFELNGRWKMFANYMQRALSPVLPSPYKIAGGDVVIELISDTVEEFSGEMRVRVFNLSSMTPLIDERAAVSATHLTSEEVHRISASSLADVGCGEGNVTSPCVVYVTIPEIPDNFLFLHYPTDKMYLQDPKIAVTQYTATPDLKTFTVTLTSDAVAPFVWLNLKEHTHGKFSDNGFIMVESPKTITYHSRQPITLQDFISQFTIMSLFDVTQFA